jgi:hypothetical protein
MDFLQKVHFQLYPSFTSAAQPFRRGQIHGQLLCHELILFHDNNCYHEKHDFRASGVGQDVWYQAGLHL